MNADHTPFAYTNRDIGALREMRVTHVEHTCDSETGAERFVLTVDLTAVTAAALLTPFALGIMHRMRQR